MKRHPASTYPQQLCKIELYDTLQSTSGQKGNVQKPNETPEYQDLIRQLRGFVDERAWSQFHSPKNLAMALTGEIGELVEHFQWLSSEASDALDATTRHDVRRELADVQIYLMLLADRLDVDLMQAVADKIEENALKYPAHRARGRSDKYDKL